jgi:hypothetical protein
MSPVDNPFQSPTELAAESDAAAAQKALRDACRIAPLVAPFSFVVLILLAAGVAVAAGRTINPAGLLLLPLLAMTIGLLASYASWSLIGLPLALALQRRQSLTGGTIHAAAFLCSIMAACLLAIPIMISSQGPQSLLLIPFLAAMIAPPALLSATCFWWLVRRKGGLS